MIRFTEPGYSRRAVLLARAHEARRWASRWDDAARRGGAGVRAAIEALYLAVEWGVRAELAEAYAKREVAS